MAGAEDGMEMAAVQAVTLIIGMAAAGQVVIPEEEEILKLLHPPAAAGQVAVHNRQHTEQVPAAALVY